MTDSVHGSPKKRIALVAEKTWRVGPTGRNQEFPSLVCENKYNASLSPKIKVYAMDEVNWRYPSFYKSEKLQVGVTYWKTQSYSTHHTTGKVFPHKSMPITQYN